jgi:hypothetical protein
VKSDLGALGPAYTPPRDDRRATDFRRRGRPVIRHGDGRDALIFRLAGAATLGYAGAGVLEARARTWGETRLQNLAPIVFNGVAAVVSLAAVAAGNGSIVVLLILVASAGFAVTFTYGQWQARVWTKRPAN